MYNKSASMDCLQKKERTDYMKKRLSMLVATVMLLTSLIPSFTVNAAFSDVSNDNPYKEAISTLSAVKVINGYEDGTFKPDKDISRAEFTKMIVYMLGMGEFSSPITTFGDVPLSHWANANIKTAYDLEIINGFDDGTFRPDQPVTYEQAIKMVVCTLGYIAAAEYKGGYPNGYRIQGEELKLTKGITGVGYEANAPRGVIAQLMFNALEVEKLERVNDTYEETGKTLLKDYLNVRKLKGVVVGVEDSTTAACNAKLTKGKIAIDDIVTGDEYVIDFKDYADSSVLAPYLGQNVSALYRMDKLSNDKWLIDISNENTKNVEVNTDSTQIYSYDSGVVRYYESNESSKTSRLTLAPSDLSIRYNGRVVKNNVVIGGSSYAPTDALAQWLDPQSPNFIYGTVKFIDNGDTGSYSIVDIYDYETMVSLRTVNSTDYRITDKKTSSNVLILDPNDISYSFTLTKNGSQAVPTQILANDVISYATSLDGSHHTVYANAKSVSGKITAIATTETPKTISIDRVKYNVSDYFLDYIQNKENKTLSNGMRITAYMDVLGTLQWATVTADEKFYSYAYVVNAMDEDESYYLRLYAPTSTNTSALTSSTSYKVKTYELAQNVKFDGARVAAEAVASNLLTTNGRTDEAVSPIVDADNIYSQLIRVSFNAENQIDGIITVAATTGTVNTDSSALVKFRGVDASKDYFTATAVKDTSDSTGTLYSIKGATPIMVIPTDRSDANGYSIKAASTLDAGSYHLAAYDVNDSRYPSCVLAYETSETSIASGTPIKHTTAYTLVGNDASEEYDPVKDEIFKTFTVFNTSIEPETIMISERPLKSFASVGFGDVILYGLDGDGYANDFKLVADYSNIKTILDGAVVGSQKYNWSQTQTQTSANDWQKYKFDWRYPKAGAGATEDYFRPNANTSGIYSRAAMFNILQVVSEENLLYVSNKGFNEADDSYAADEYETVKVSNNTKILRYVSEPSEDYFIPFAQGTSTPLTINDLKGAKDFGSNCSKILITYIETSNQTVAPTADMIIIYQ